MEQLKERLNNEEKAPKSGRESRHDAADGVPENRDGLADFDLQAGLVHELAQVEIGLEAEAIAEGGIEFLDEAEERVLALEMVQENEVSARFADALHFFHDGDWVGHGRNEICSKD